MIEVIGLVAAACFAVSGAPQALKSYREKNSDGISHGLIWLWLIGELGMTIYVIGTTMDPILLFNYVANLLLVGTIAWYKYFPEGQTLGIRRLSNQILERKSVTKWHT